MVLQRSANYAEKTHGKVRVLPVLVLESAKDHGIIFKSGSRSDLHAVRSDSWKAAAEFYAVFKLFRGRKQTVYLTSDIFCEPGNLSHSFSSVSVNLNAGIFHSVQHHAVKVCAMVNKLSLSCVSNVVMVYCLPLSYLYPKCKAFR